MKYRVGFAAGGSEPPLLCDFFFYVEHDRLLVKKKYFTIITDIRIEITEIGLVSEICVPQAERFRQG